jgi:hypothetical protein
MRLRTLFAASTALALALPAVTHAQVAEAPDATDTAPGKATGPAPTSEPPMPRPHRTCRVVAAPPAVLSSNCGARG